MLAQSFTSINFLTKVHVCVQFMYNNLGPQTWNRQGLFIILSKTRQLTCVCVNKKGGSSDFMSLNQFEDTCMIEFKVLKQECISSRFVHIGIGDNTSMKHTATWEVILPISFTNTHWDLWICTAPLHHSILILVQNEHNIVDIVQTCHHLKMVCLWN